MNWIDITKELPPYSKMVLVSRMGDTTQSPPIRLESTICRRSHTDGDGEHWCTAKDNKVTGHVTHWMFIPEYSEIVTVLEGSEEHRAIKLEAVIDSIFSDLLKEGVEVISMNGLRFTGTLEEKIKEVFNKHGIEYKNPF